MKKLQKIGRVLTRKEMKSVAGGFRQCGQNDGFVCGPPCTDPYGPPSISEGWQCDSPTGACKPHKCLYILDPM
jgi:hypothetical protein